MTSLRVYGVPKGQPRTKACIRGKHAGVYTPSTADAWKLAIVAAWRQANPYAEPSPYPQSLGVVILAPRPGRLNTKKCPPERQLLIVKPDVDNYVKAILDALTMAGAWLDDAQVVQLRAQKHYAAKGEAPGAEISVEEVAP